MKTQILSKLIVIFCFGIFISCGILNQDEDNLKGTMQAKINGKLIIFNEAYGDRILEEDWTWSEILEIVGKTDLNDSGYEIQIGFPFNPIKGNIYHPFCMYRPWIGNYYNYNNPTAYLTKRMNPEGLEFSSTVIFTSIANNRYIGTFSFTAYIVSENLNDSIVVTDGKFEIDSDGRKFKNL